MYLYDRNMLATTNYKYANSLSNYYITMVVLISKNFKIKLPIYFAFLRHEVPSKANNKRESVVVCAPHIMKRPSKRSALTINYEVSQRSVIDLPIFLFSSLYRRVTCW